MESEADFRNYFEEHILIRRVEMDETAKQIRECVNKILEKVHEKDDRFDKQPIISGSYSEHLKVDEPDEFDFMVPLTTVSELTIMCDMNDVTKNEWAITFNNLDTRWNNSSPQLFDPRHMMQVFQDRVSNALKECAPCHAKTCRLKPNCPAVTVAFQVNNQEVDVDLVPIIYNPLKSWPLKWPRSKKWPLRERVEEIMDRGIDVAAKKAWRVSFSRAERLLIKSIDVEGGRRRDSLKFLKYLKQTRIPAKYEHILCSYHLKTTLFWACERNPDNAQWDGLKVSLELLITTLLGFLDEWKIPHYFLPRVNLLDENENLKHEFRHYAHNTHFM